MEEQRIAADMRQQEGEQGLANKGKGIDLQAIFDAIPAEQTAAQISDEQWERIAEQLQAAAEAGILQAVALSFIEKISQAAQEVQEAKEGPRKIVIDTGDYDPGLDQNAPELAIEAYRKAIADTGDMEAMIERLKGTAPVMTQEAIAHNEEAVRDTAAVLATAVQYDLKGIADFVNSDTYKAVKERIAAISSFIAQHSAETAALSGLAEGIPDLAPFLAIELEEMQQDPEFADYTLQDLLEQGFDADGTPTDSPFRQLIERAKQRQADFEAAKDTIEAATQLVAELPRIIANPTDLLTYPLDKPNSRIWNLLAAADPNGQLKLEIETTSDTDKKKGKEAIIYYGINFDESDGVRYTKQLTPFDKRVYIAAAALFNGGNDVMSATQIYKMMGNNGLPKADQIEKINESLNKMRTATVYIDTTKEVTVNKGYPKFIYDGALIEFRRISAYINGTRTDAAIWLLAEPPLITFAKKRRQSTNIPRLLLESPVNKTNANLTLDDYLIDRISHMKNNKKLSRKMLFSTIYERCGITTKKQKQRAPEKIQRYLDHYEKCGWIEGYTTDKDGVAIQIKPIKE